MAAQTLFDKIWQRHVIEANPQGSSLLRIDRHYIHDLVAGPALADLRGRDRTVAHPELTFATPDHAISSAPGRDRDPAALGGRFIRQMRKETAAAGIRMFDIGKPGQGIVHVMAPEMGLTLPGMLIVCGDSHTCTHGGLGAIAFGIGSSEVVHVLATQALRQMRPRTMRVSFEGVLARGVFAKDLILHLIGKLGTAGGRGFAVEFAGSAIRSMDVEARLTVCNLSIEFGAKMGFIAPDETTFQYLEKRPWAPHGSDFDHAVLDWSRLPSDPDSTFDVEHVIHAQDIAPQVTWGTSPEDVIAIDANIPDPDLQSDPQRRARMHAALDYMGLQPRTPLAGTPVDWVFIGSCANSRLSDLREAARVIEGRTVASSVRAWVVPGSEMVKRSAEAEGLDKVFRRAGFEWREPGCSLCIAANGDSVGPGQRCVSTSNRNFVGRQGKGARTHLASPATAAACALTGRISDARTR
jgi:3-isopropylmalate/(R)-2-methylmalate dehydratase large subunit